MHSVKVSAGLMLLLLGGLLVVIGSFMPFFGAPKQGLPELAQRDSNVAYLYIFPISGILIVLFAGLSVSLGSRAIALITGLCGLLILIIGTLFLVQQLYSTPDGFRGSVIRFVREYFGYGFYIVTSGGLIAIIGGAVLSKGLKTEKLVEKELPAPMPAVVAKPIPQYTQPPGMRQGPEKQISISTTFPSTSMAAVRIDEPLPPPPPDEELPPPPDDELPPPPPPEDEELPPPPPVQNLHEEPEEETSDELEEEREESAEDENEHSSTGDKATR